jgi:acylphosphatase
MTRARIIYSGTVQGVGFRYTVQRYAVSHGLKGWVKNCRDGTVEIQVEGPKDTIEELCQTVEEHFQEYIQNKDIQFSSPETVLKEFKIIQ